MTDLEREKRMARAATLRRISSKHPNAWYGNEEWYMHTALPILLDEYDGMDSELKNAEAEIARLRAWGVDLGGIVHVAGVHPQGVEGVRVVAHKAQGKTWDEITQAEDRLHREGTPVSIHTIDYADLEKRILSGMIGKTVVLDESCRLKEETPMEERNCFDCVHVDVDANDLPCEDCWSVSGWPHFEAAEAEVPEQNEAERDCDNCMHGDVEYDEPPCEDCWTEPNWPNWKAVGSGHRWSECCGTCEQDMHSCGHGTAGVAPGSEKVCDHFTLAERYREVKADVYAVPGGWRVSCWHNGTWVSGRCSSEWSAYDLRDRLLKVFNSGFPKNTLQDMLRLVTCEQAIYNHGPMELQELMGTVRGILGKLRGERFRRDKGERFYRAEKILHRVEFARDLTSKDVAVLTTLVRQELSYE